MIRLPLVLVLCSVLRVVHAQALDAEAFARQLTSIIPTAEERDFQAIPWRTELRAALVEASQAQKPVLLWAMNGHPLGQT